MSTILLIENQLRFRDIEEAFLKTNGFTVLVNEDWKTAEKTLREEPVDAIVAAANLKDTVGFEISRRVHVAHPWMSVIVLSDNVTVASREYAIKDGAFDLLSRKDFHANIVELLNSAIEASQASKEHLENNDPDAPLATVLVVEDFIPFRNQVARGLRKSGYRVLTALGGDEAVEIVRTNKVDAVFMDIHIPTIDGVEAAGQIRKLVPNMPIAIMSGEAPLERRREGVPVSTMGCIDKANLSLADLGKITEGILRVSKSEIARQRAEAHEAAKPQAQKALENAQRKVGKFREYSRTHEFRMVLVGILLGVILVGLILRGLDRFERYLATPSDTPSFTDMYRNITGYLERDEKRELEREKR